MSIKSKVINMLGAINEKYGTDFDNLTDAIQYALDNGGASLADVFVADFSGSHPLPSQFYAWEGRVYAGAIYDSLSNIECVNGTARLTSKYDASNSRWIKQIMTTAGLFESDNFTLTFKAKFDGYAGSWQNVITYGTGTYWTNRMYSDGVKWSAGGEIDAFEQAGGYSDTPNTFFTPTVHYGAGTESGYPNSHEYVTGETVRFTTDEWHNFKLVVKDGVISTYIDEVLCGTRDVSECRVDNNYLWNYRPFIKPQAFYIDVACASDNSKTDKAHEYVFEVKDFKITQREDVPCSALEIYPQMWARGTGLVFPVGAEVFFDKAFTPVDTSNKACTWESSNTSVATVVQGFVSVKGVGQTTITARCGSAVATYNLLCSASANVPCVGVRLDREEIATDSDFDLTAYIYPKFSTDAVVWESDDNGVATVADGHVTLHGAGDCNIICRVGNMSASIAVTSNYDDSLTPIIAYDFAPLTANIGTKNAENVTIANSGSLGSVYDITSAGITKNSYDLDNQNYASAAYVQYYTFNTEYDAPIAYNASDSILFVVRGLNRAVLSTARTAYNTLPNYIKFASAYPVIQSITNDTTITAVGNLGGATLTATVTDMSSEHNIAFYKQGASWKLFVDGVLASSVPRGDASSITKFSCKEMNGRNLRKIEVYTGYTLTDQQIIDLMTSA